MLFVLANPILLDRDQRWSLTGPLVLSLSKHAR